MQDVLGSICHIYHSSSTKDSLLWFPAIPLIMWAKMVLIRALRLRDTVLDFTYAQSLNSI